MLRAKNWEASQQVDLKLEVKQLKEDASRNTKDQSCKVWKEIIDKAR